MRLNRPTPARSATRQKLAMLAKQWSNAGSRPEDAFWEQQLAHEIDNMLRSGKDTPLISVLDELWQSDPKAYELLADFVEDRIQTQHIAQEFTTLLIAIPVLAWSRNQLPLGETSKHLMAQLKQTMYQFCLADNVELTLGHTLYAPDSLPQGFAQTAKLAKKYFDAAKLNVDLAYNRKEKLEVDTHYLADTRFWLGTIKAKPGSALFKWQLEEQNIQTIHAQWAQAATAASADMFLGCSHKVLPPSGYFSACRRAESDIRAFSLEAAVLMITSSLDIKAEQLKAVIGGCWTSGFEEFRISLIVRNTELVLQGVSWPLLGHDEDEQTLLNDIEALLSHLGVGKVILLDEKLSLEYCDDCGTPLFPDVDAEMVHPSNPSEDEHDSTRLTVH